MIVLDTHVLLWWVTGASHRLSAPAAQAIEGELPSGQIMVSSISAWELAMLVERGRVALAMDISEWLSTVGLIDGLTFVPVSNEIAVNSAALPGPFHKDPADRIIVATARRLGAVLATADEKIQAYPLSACKDAVVTRGPVGPSSHPTVGGSVEPRTSPGRKAPRRTNTKVASATIQHSLGISQRTIDKALPGSLRTESRTPCPQTGGSTFPDYWPV